MLQLLGLPHRLHIGLLACICVTDATLLSMWRTISRPKPQQPFHQRTYRQTGRDIAGPMRQQDDPGRDQSRPDRPDQITFCGSKHGGGRGEGADVNGVAGGKGIEAIQNSPAAPFRGHSPGLGLAVREGAEIRTSTVPDGS